jgi:antitoxin CptB
VNATTTELNRLYWHSRRGMLELDLLLVPFAQRHLPSLTAEQQHVYERLLAEEDQDLHSWLSRRELAPDAQLQNMIEIILGKHEPQKL